MSRRRRRAPGPSGTTSTSYPSKCRPRRTNPAMLGSSSTTRMRLLFLLDRLGSATRCSTIERRWYPQKIAASIGARVLPTRTSAGVPGVRHGLRRGGHFGGHRFRGAGCPGMAGGDLLRQHFGDVLRFAVGEVLDLLPAGDPGHATDRELLADVDRREKPFLADLARNLVVLGFVAERAGHAAATGAALVAVQPAAFRIAIEGPSRSAPSDGSARGTGLRPRVALSR